MTLSAQTRRWWDRLMPKTLAAQLIGLLLVAVFISQVLSLIIFQDARRIAMISVARDNILMRAVSIAKLLEETPAAMHPRILEASGSRSAAFWISRDPAARTAGDSSTEQALEDMVARSFPGRREVHLNIRRDDPRPEDYRRKPGYDDDDGPEHRSWDDRTRGDRPDRLPRVLRRAEDLALSIALPGGEWLNVATRYRPPPGALIPMLTQLGLTVAGIVLVIALAVRRVTRPLKDLASAAERLGRGEDLPPLDVRGPSEVRAVTSAFNDMQARLTRFVRDRTRMLAAISHDLRTPITSLRLRAEFIEDDENRDKIIETLDEMAQMAEAALSFARDEARSEQAEKTDLSALLSTLVDDQQDMGHQAALEPGDRLVVSCRPVALKRAFRNLIENGIRYGGGVTVCGSREDGDVIVRVVDNGPGIPDDRLNDVFEPFVRLEESRSEETGGIGLGLAITRSIIHAHGGTIALRNRPGGGLEAEVRLPAM